MASINGYRISTLIRTVFIIGICAPLLTNAAISSASGGKRSHFRAECEKSYSVKCFKMDVVSYIEKFPDRKVYDILPGVSVVRESSVNDSRTADIVAEMAKSFPNDPEKRLDGYLFAKLSHFLQSHTLRLRLLDEKSIEEARSEFSGRKSKLGKKGGLEAILAAGLMMKGTLMAIALGGLALLAGKALMTGLLALMLSSIIGLKSLASQGNHGKSTTYEIFAKPVYTASQTHSVSHEDIQGHTSHSAHSGHSGYGSYSARSLNLNLPPYLAKH